MWKQRIVSFLGRKLLFIPFPSNKGASSKKFCKELEKLSYRVFKFVFFEELKKKARCPSCSNIYVIFKISSGFEGISSAEKFGMRFPGVRNYNQRTQMSRFLVANLLNRFRKMSQFSWNFSKQILPITWK